MELVGIVMGFVAGFTLAYVIATIQRERDYKHLLQQQANWLLHQEREKKRQGER